MALPVYTWSQNRPVTSNNHYNVFTIFHLSGTKPYDVTPRKNRLEETILTSGHIIGFWPGNGQYILFCMTNIWSQPSCT